MNILVTGANGQLGNELRIMAGGRADNFIFTDVTEAGEEQVAMLRRLAGDSVRTDTVKLDITDAAAVRNAVAENHVDAIINCAAYTNVEAAEDNCPLAELLNAKAPENLAAAAKEYGAFLLHISTDYVFGGEPYNTPCREDMKGTPTGVYGRTKLHGEQAIQGSGCNYAILRTAWLYSEFGKNFLKTMFSLTASKPELKVVFDQTGTPTYAYNLALALMAVLDDYRTSAREGGVYARNGIYNYSDEGVCSWYDFTVMIAGYAGHSSCAVKPCHSDEFPSKVVRPSYSVLDKTLIKETFGVRVPYWTEGVRKCVELFSGL